MDVKKFSVLEKVAISIGLLLFVSITFLIIFQRDWLDDLIYGSLPEEAGIFLEEEGALPYNDSGVLQEDAESYVKIAIESDVTGQANLFLDVFKDTSITGVELEFKKEGSFEISDLVCELPFECLVFEDTESVVSLVMIVSPNNVDIQSVGQLPLGSFKYSELGTLVLSSESIVSSIEDPEMNILDMSAMTFVLN